MGIDLAPASGIQALALRAGYKSTGSLMLKSRHDSDPVSVFINGRVLDQSDMAIFVVKDGWKARQVFDDLVSRGLITAGKPVVDEGSAP